MSIISQFRLCRAGVWLLTAGADGSVLNTGRLDA